MAKKVSMKDIAAELGVSVALVSYVLNGKFTNRIKAETAEKIKHLAKKYDYQPNQKVRVSMMGYEDRVVEIQNFGTLQVILQEGQQELEELLVVGYGTQGKRTVTASIGRIDGDKFENESLCGVING